MNRKIIRQKDSYTATLPIKWIRENRLENDGEISVEQEGSRIIIQPGDAEKQLKKTEISLKGSNESIFRSILGGLYRAGYDEVKVKFESPKSIAGIQKAVDSLYGFEMLDIGKDSCTIKTVFKEESNELKSYLLKMVHTIKTMQEIILEDVQKRKYESKNELYQFRANVLKQREIISRIIIQQKLLDNQHFPYHTLAFNLWYISRYYSYFYNSLGKNSKFTEKSIELLKKTNNYFAESFSEKAIEKLPEKYETFSELVMEAQNMLENPKESHAIPAYCISILMMTQSCSSFFLQLRY